VSLLVVDASIIVAALYPTEARSHAAAARLRSGAALFVCAHTDAEVLQTVRNLARKDTALDDQRVRDLLNDFDRLPVRRITPDKAQRQRAWDLRHNLSAYDALYVAAAETLHGSLLTGDARLAAAPGPRCPIELIA
jgi:predicted nucleic acid-binding protein